MDSKKSLISSSLITDSCSRIDLAAKEFVSLTEQHENVNWNDPKRLEIRESLDKLISIHWQNNEFISKIENSGSKVAASSIKIEIHLQEVARSHSRHQFDR